MRYLTEFHARHQRLLRFAWLAVVVFLAACNTGDNSAPGGGGGY